MYCQRSAVPLLQRRAFLFYTKVYGVERMLQRAQSGFLCVGDPVQGLILAVAFHPSRRRRQEMLSARTRPVSNTVVKAQRAFEDGKRWLKCSAQRHVDRYVQRRRPCVPEDTASRIRTKERPIGEGGFRAAHHQYGKPGPVESPCFKLIFGFPL